MKMYFKRMTEFIFWSSIVFMIMQVYDPFEKFAHPWSKAFPQFMKANDDNRFP